MKLKQLAVIALGATCSIGSAGALAKAHDQGVADGTRIDPSNLRGGVVAGVNTPGIGASNPNFVDADGNLLCAGGFCGVVGDDGQTYGKTIVSVQRELGIRRVTPVDQPGRNKPSRGE